MKIILVTMPLFLAGTLVHADTQNVVESVPVLPQRPIQRALGVELPDTTIAAYRRAIEIAGAFANDGFKMRDGFFSGEIMPGKQVVVEVNLYKGNEYWFTVATHGTGSRPSLALFDELGYPLQVQSFEDENAAAAGVVADASGKVFVRISLESGPASPFVLLYSYK
jgi:hypothetical protein